MKQKLLISVGLSVVLFGSGLVSLVRMHQIQEADPYYIEVKPIPLLAAGQAEPVEPSVIAAPTQPPDQGEETFTNDDYLLAKIAKAEAGNQDTEGKALVIRVVMNRVSDQDFPDSVKGVMYQENQFSPVLNGTFELVEPDEDCWTALEMVRDGWDESQGALFFERASDSTWHRDNLKYLFTHEDHLFYTYKEGVW